MTAKKKEVFVRFNARITKKQKIAITKIAKKEKVSEGEVLRNAVENFITNNA